MFSACYQRRYELDLTSLIRESIEQAQLCVTASKKTLVIDIERATNVLIGALLRGRKILTCGNGGSAGDAQHLASELVNRFETERIALAAISLVPDSSVVTAIANDYAYDLIFSRQVEALGNKGDVLVVFTTSGNSRNILRAIKTAQERQMTVIAMTGKNGGQAREILGRFDIEVRAPADTTARIQEIHLLVIHSICKALDLRFTGYSLTRPPKVQKDWSDLKKITHGIRPLVFTNGVFDLLHRGHVHYLQKAQEMGACLVVGINSDASVGRLGKGIGRPIQNEDDRAHILAELTSIDYVTIFDEETPENLISAIEPDLLVKGGDYSIRKIIGEDLVLSRGGRVEIIPIEFKRSTSAIVQYINSNL